MVVVITYVVVVVVVVMLFINPSEERDDDEHQQVIDKRPLAIGLAAKMMILIVVAVFSNRCKRRQRDGDENHLIKEVIPLTTAAIVNDISISEKRDWLQERDLCLKQYAPMRPKTIS